MEKKSTTVSVLGPDGKPEGDLPELGDEELVRLLTGMLRIRVLDTRLLNMQRQGRIGFYGTATGEEASVIGSVGALRNTDWIFPALRQGGALLYRGFPLAGYVAQCIGNSFDNLKGRQMPVHASSSAHRVVSWSSVIGTQLSQATGAALAAKIRGDDVVVMAYMGDGATSSAEFHVSLNFAKVYEVPVIFLCQNNQWAISVPFSRQSRTTVAEKAVAYGMPGIRVDGNDVLAVYRETKAAVDRARAGKGPSLIECLTYRIGGHSSSDDPTRYRKEGEVADWEKRDPLDRFSRFLADRGIMDASSVGRLKETIGDEVAEAIRKAEAADPLPVASLFEDVYAAATPGLQEQAALAEGRRAGDRIADAAFPL